jgi:hypothetical protein
MTEETRFPKRPVDEEDQTGAVRRLAEGKAHAPSERHSDQAERRVADEVTERARAGERFPSMLLTRRFTWLLRPLRRSSARRSDLDK